MWRVLKRFFGFVPKQNPPVKNEEEFENLNAFMNGSADLNINSVTDSRSTLFFKEASNILEDKEINENSEEVIAMQSFISSSDENHTEEEQINIEEENILVEN